MTPRFALMFVGLAAVLCAATYWNEWMNLTTVVPANYLTQSGAVTRQQRVYEKKLVQRQQERVQERVHQVVVHSNKATNVLEPFYLNNVVSVDVLHASIPRSQYVIDEYNCTLDIRSPAETGNVVTVTLVKGDLYDATSLASSLQEAICCSLPNFSIEFMQHDSTYKFTSESSFELLFKSGPHSSTSLFRELGFTGDDVKVENPTNDCHDQYTVISQCRSDLSGARYVHVQLPQLERVHPEAGFLAQIALLPPHPFGVINNRNVPIRKFQNILIKTLTIKLIEINPKTKTVRDYLLNGLYFSLTLRIVTLEKAKPWSHKLAPLKSNLNAIYSN
jgi:hypothetical protein